MPAVSIVASYDGTFNGVATAQTEGLVEIPDRPHHQGPSPVLVHLDAATIAICES